MNFPFYIARRYVFAKKSHNAINVIAVISITGIAVSTVAFIFVLSIFNGFDSLVKDLFNTFYADFEIVPTEGKTFKMDSLILEELKNHKDILNLSEILEDDALIVHNNKQTVATVRGVDREYSKVTGLDTMVYRGVFELGSDSNPYAYLGRAIQGNLNVQLMYSDTLRMIALKRQQQYSNDIYRNINHKNIHPTGSFSSHAEIESKYIIVPIAFARELFGYSSEISAIEIKAKQGVNMSRLQKSIQKSVGNKLKVKNRIQQNDLVYRTMRTEKWAIFFILVFILLVATFNLVGTLSMLIIEKKDDIKTLRNLGAPLKQIKRTFLIEGLIISFIGAISGLIIGIILCILQKELGILKMEGDFVTNSYPVEIQAADIILVLITVIAIGFVASWYPIRFITKKHLKIST